MHTQKGLKPKLTLHPTILFNLPFSWNLNRKIEQNTINKGEKITTKQKISNLENSGHILVKPRFCYIVTCQYIHHN